MDVDTDYANSMFHEFEDQSMEDIRKDDNPIFPTQFREKIGSESESDIIEKGIQTVIGLGDHKEGMEYKDAGDDDFVTQEEKGKKAQGHVGLDPGQDILDSYSGCS
ncbi:hypothetical protein PanWU01x14_095200 [Parasponia andersonii]|uniref:Uncharacterized protein n=1 Tax=Parasponia andersonii TaxID=3476 RepID=A0A2P5D5H2_PARAD|nr:hypothetical protein PanWU01x14_095200 [Parasponia andersonii]